MTENGSLAGALRESGLTQAELADKVNARLICAGHEGTVSDRTVRNWLTGKTLWPHPRQREALEAVFGCTAVELGFSAPERRRPSNSLEAPVNRRNFLTATTGTTVAVSVPLVGAPPQVGTSDVIRLRRGLDALMEVDRSRGGHEGLERAALLGAQEALAKQKLGATQRIRRRLFSVAADYTATAAWSAIDARRLDRAHVLLGKALYLAGMAKDPIAEMRVWNSYAMLAHHRHEFTEAVDAAYAAQGTGIARRVPFFASLAHARTAVGHANLRDRQAALRSLGHAEDALTKAEAAGTAPSWIAFYGPAELLAMTAIVRDRIGDAAESEAASHNALATIPEEFRRNRALAMCRLALAQLHQRDVDQACSTASTVFTLMSGHPIPGRMRSLLGDYYRDLITLAPDASIAREWGDRYRTEWSRL
ncbi:helix-turn-helix domain-containing protein [Streptomyces sp. PsTaAH-124]|uniref:helix-turn-helix domain-containing protein n=1 Tax=Streptomyces sp. PsTaAH-124 TaxID=1157638 RepID=UPI000380EBEF|nr:helix-turn-helix transcriptional regulator [Streptomyces sp. PsTaAH-124]